MQPNPTKKGGKPILFSILSFLRVLRPPGGGSNISFGADEEKPPVRKNKMASSVFAEPEDPYANRRNNPPGGKPTGVLCGEPSAPLRRGGNHGISHTGEGGRPMIVILQTSNPTLPLVVGGRLCLAAEPPPVCECVFDCVNGSVTVKRFVLVTTLVTILL
uniref:Jupiter microtubule associated homolog 1a n=1 Tax=Oryzias sinensis TaxID=183150 RepID=A0A8C7XI98_9TELE